MGSVGRNYMSILEAPWHDVANALRQTKKKTKQKKTNKTKQKAICSKQACHKVGGGLNINQKLARTHRIGIKRARAYTAELEHGEMKVDPPVYIHRIHRTTGKANSRKLRAGESSNQSSQPINTICFIATFYLPLYFCPTHFCLCFEIRIYLFLKLFIYYLLPLTMIIEC